MIWNINVLPNTIRKPTVYSAYTGMEEEFPILTIDKDSYIVGAKIESVINYHWNKGTYNLQIGKYCACAEDILFMIDIDHEYDGVFMGEISEIYGGIKTHKSTMKSKGEIIIQNDCWIGHGAVLMDGVTVHNGAVVATNAVVTKDVPPYAIVAGNPARVVKYRFDEKTIHKLQHIAWWDWDSDTITKYKEKLLGEVKDFVDYFYSDDSADETIKVSRLTEGSAFVFYLDMNEPYCVWKKVIRQFVESMNGSNSELILYLDQREPNFEENSELLLQELLLYEKSDCYVSICTELFEDDAVLLQIADYYISNRQEKNIHRMCKGELYGVKHLIGVSDRIFYNCKW